MKQALGALGAIVIASVVGLYLFAVASLGHYLGVHEVGEYLAIPLIVSVTLIGPLLFVVFRKQFVSFVRKCLNF